MSMVKRGFAVILLIAPAVTPSQAQMSLTPTPGADAALESVVRAPLPRPRPRVVHLPTEAAPQGSALRMPFGPAAPTTSSAFASFVASSPAVSQAPATIQFQTTPGSQVIPSLAIPSLAPTSRGILAVPEAAATDTGARSAATFPSPRLAAGTTYSTAGVPFPPSVIASAANIARADAQFATGEPEPPTAAPPDAALPIAVPPSAASPGTAFSGAASPSEAPAIAALPATAPQIEVPEPMPQAAAAAAGNRALAPAIRPTPVAAAVSAAGAPVVATTGRGALPPPGIGPRQIRITNNTTATVASLSITPIKGRASPIGVAGNLGPFKSINAPLPAGRGCDFAVHGAFEDGSPLSIDGIDLCRDPLINITVW